MNDEGVDFRVVAVDKQGKKHTTESGSTVRASDIKLSQWHFNNLKPHDIDRFEFQTREYQRTDIKGLPVEPGARTAQTPARPRLTVREVTILTSENEIDAAQRDRRTNVMNWSPRKAGARRFPGRRGYCRC